MDTPDLSHLKSDDYNNVYEPAEDSFLLLDALESNLQNLVNMKPGLCIEVGSGTGIISTAVAKALGNTCFCIAVDINPVAVRTTSMTAKHNNVDVEAIQGDLVFPLLSRLRSQVDILIFNPPYVVTPSSEVGSKGIEASWAGGMKGREVLDRLLPHVSDILSDKGHFYLVALKENDIEDICNFMKKQGLLSKILLSRRAGREHLSILCFTKSY